MPQSCRGWDQETSQLDSAKLLLAKKDSLILKVVLGYYHVRTCVPVAVCMNNVCTQIMTVYLTCSGDEDVFGDASHGKAQTKHRPSMDTQEKWENLDLSVGLTM